MGNRVILDVQTLDIVGRLKINLRVFLGALWLLDGLLQLQPQMFTPNFPSQVLLPSFQTLPEPLHAFALNTLYPNIQLHEKIFNVAALTTQAAIGVGLVWAPRRLYRSTLIASTAWSALIWVFGQAFGGIFALSGGGALTIGSPSLYTGLPGSALVYLYLSLILLLPNTRWAHESQRRFSPLWDFAPLLLLIGLIAQLNPNMFTAAGQSTIFQANINTNIPASLAWTVEPIARYSVSSPLVANIFEVTPLLISIIMWFTGYRRPAFIMGCALCVFAWWFGMGLGAMLTGLGTDPNTPPLLLAASWLALNKPLTNKTPIERLTA